MRARGVRLEGRWRATRERLHVEKETGLVDDHRRVRLSRKMELKLGIEEEVG